MSRSEKDVAGVNAGSSEKERGSSGENNANEKINHRRTLLLWSMKITRSGRRVTSSRLLKIEARRGENVLGLPRRVGNRPRI